MAEKSLPDNDPFAYTATDAPSQRKTNILRGYWLSQVIFYTVFGLWELKGIIIMRALILLICLYFTFLTIRKQENVPFWVAIMLLSAVFITIKGFTGERPVLFTFVAFSCVYYCLEDFRINRSKKLFLIPPIVMMLSNMHPGFIVCILLVTVYAVGESIEFLIRRSVDRAVLMRYGILFVVTVVFSSLNPNGPLMLTRLFSMHGEHIKGILEFMPTFFIYKYKVAPVNYAYIAFLVLSLLNLRYFKKIGVVHVLLLVIFTYMSIMAIRYQIFYVCIAAPIIARLINGIGHERFMTALPHNLKVREGLLNLLVFVVALYFSFGAVPAFARYEFAPDVYYHIPKGASDFLSKIDMKGNMLNEYGIGGYLIWRLYPEKKVFIDGRALEPDVYKEYQNIVKLKKTGPDSWEDILKKYEVSYVIMPPLFQHGRIIPLVEELFDSDEWILIYRDHLTFVFVKDDGFNAPIIDRFKIDKKLGLYTIVVQTSARALIAQSNPHYLLSLGKALFKMGKPDEAVKAFKMAKERDPDNTMIEFWLDKVKQGEK